MTNKAMARIGHITTHFLPIAGGQEVYIQNLIECLAGHQQTVYQMDNRGPAVDSLEGVRIVSLPRRSVMPLVVNYSFELVLRRGMIRNEDLLIVNYPEYVPAIQWHKKTIVLSHGATWTSMTGRG
ncbi:MAG: hypothetical protein IMZ61_01095, partial [Planctomycetes bacterium]|nr:hypothetical protein [Planctomycetota bacterium]